MAAAKGKSLNWHASTIPGSVTFGAVSYRHEVRTAPYRVGQVRLCDWRHHILHRGQILFDLIRNLRLRQRVPHGAKRPKVDDYRREIFIRHLLESHVGHQREESAAIVTDAFTDRLGKLLVGPGASSGLNIRSQVGR